MGFCYCPLFHRKLFNAIGSQRRVFLSHQAGTNFDQFFDRFTPGFAMDLAPLSIRLVALVLDNGEVAVNHERFFGKVLKFAW